MNNLEQFGPILGAVLAWDHVTFISDDANWMRFPKA